MSEATGQIMAVDEALLAKVNQRYPILKYFQYGHLPEKLQNISRPFSWLATDLAYAKPDGCPETAAGLRKLLEGKDCAVRAAL